MVSTPTSRAAVRRWWAASWGRVWRETQSPRCITGRIGKTDKSSVSTSWQPLLSPHGAPPLRTQMQRVSPASLGADASANPGAHATYPAMPQTAAVATSTFEQVYEVFGGFFDPILKSTTLKLAARLNHQASSSVPLNYVFVDKAKAKHPMIATIPAGTRCGFPRFMASARWTIRAECTVNVGWMGKCCL